jgi:hypothetical protein
MITNAKARIAEPPSTRKDSSQGRRILSSDLYISSATLKKFVDVAGMARKGPHAGEKEQEQ